MRLVSHICLSYPPARVNGTGEKRPNQYILAPSKLRWRMEDSVDWECRGSPNGFKIGQLYCGMSEMRVIIHINIFYRTAECTCAVMMERGNKSDPWSTSNRFPTRKKKLYSGSRIIVETLDTFIVATHDNNNIIFVKRYRRYLHAK